MRCIATCSWEGVSLIMCVRPVMRSRQHSSSHLRTLLVPLVLGLHDTDPPTSRAAQRALDTRLPPDRHSAALVSHHITSRKAQAYDTHTEALAVPGVVS